MYLGLHALAIDLVNNKPACVICVMSSALHYDQLSQVVTIVRQILYNNICRQVS